MLRRWRRPQLALLALLLAVGIGYGIDALRNSGPTSVQASASASGSTTGSTTGSSVAAAAGNVGNAGKAVELSSLPVQVAQTVRLIKAGGPFPYSQDGVVFDNNEHLLPAHPHGYYHEYTVPTPGASDRATRRIVTGRAGEYFYTSDHYESFERIDVTG